jgi:all-trans-retinol 13,14-reductase
MPRQFDAIVIGSGLGGLTAGALYARAGYRVLVLERNVQFGGAATVYHHGSLAIEASLHEIDGLDAEDPKVPILRALGLDHDIPFVGVGDLHEVRSPLLGEPFVIRRRSRGGQAALSSTSQGDRWLFRAHPCRSSRGGNDQRTSGRPRLVAMERADLAVAAMAAHS